MKIKIENKSISISRKQMIEVRRMDHNQLDGFMSNLYEVGMKEGEKKEALKHNVELCQMRQQAWTAFLSTINEIKGIGETRRQELRIAFRNNYGKEETDE